MLNYHNSKAILLNDIRFYILENALIFDQCSKIMILKKGKIKIHSPANQFTSLDLKDINQQRNKFTLSTSEYSSKVSPKIKETTEQIFVNHLVSDKVIISAFIILNKFIFVILFEINWTDFKF